MAIGTIENLKRYRSQAKEGKPVLSVPQEDFEATLPFLSPTVAAMARLQWLTGMRSGELVQMRWMDIEKPEGGGPWLYTPSSHKTAHLGKERPVFLGPACRQLLSEFEKADATAPIFSPAESDLAFRKAKRAARKSKVQPSQVERQEKARKNPKRKFRPAYDSRAYGRAIARACKAAGVPHWHPHRLRHTFATRVRKLRGLEAAQVTLGHATINTTELYAEKNQKLAREVAEDLS